MYDKGMARGDYSAIGPSHSQYGPKARMPEVAMHVDLAKMLPGVCAKPRLRLSQKLQKVLKTGSPAVDPAHVRIPNQAALAAL